MGQYIGFNLGKEEYVIPIIKVQEIMKPSQATRLPQTPDSVSGIINLRGKTISVLNLRHRLGLNCEDVTENGNIIVVNLGRITFGIEVGAITGVMTIEKDMIKTDIAYVSGKDGCCVSGIAKINGGKMVIILDFPKLLVLEDNSLLEDDIVGSEEAEDGTTIITKRVMTIGGEFFVKEVRESLVKTVAGKGIGNSAVEKIMDEVQRLLGAFASANVEEAEKAIDVLSRFGDREMFSGIGKMTRKLHDSLNEFKRLLDDGLRVTADEVMSDAPAAQDKLEWVIAKTEEAASNTITIAEKNQAKLAGIQQRLDMLEAEFGASVPGAEKDTFDFLRLEINEINNDFMEIMLAQEFQDVTGQILRKVITLVRELESQLVKLILMFGVKPETQSGTDKTETAVPQEMVYAAQEDVDAMLAEFGF
ncbi:MAG: protein phosphatase CheZ [Nitrospirae bacterium]|nr:protein phosphatase CheZ [Nitrospirota bacterium]